MKGDDLVGQTEKTSVVREDSCMITTPGITNSVAELADADKENISDGVGSFAGNKSGTCVMENEEILGMGNSEVGDEGLENITPEMVSNIWVVDSCLEFYPKVGITCEGEEKNMKVLLEGIEKTRQQPVVEEGGMSISSRGFDCYVNYERGMADVQQGKGRGRGRFGVL